MGNTRPTIEKWLQWFHRIDEDITRLHNSREVWREVRKMVAANPEIPHPDFFLGWLTNLYVSAEVIGIRRQADNKFKGDATMAWLLKDMQADPELLSRDELRRVHIDRALPAYGNDEAETAEIVDMTLPSVAEEFLVPNGSAIDTEAVKADATKLEAAAKRVRSYVNNELAHLGASPFQTPPTWEDVNEALDVLGDLLARYTRFLLGSDRVLIAPVIQDPWQAAFTVAWRRLPGDDENPYKGGD